MEDRQYYRFTESNDNEGETWRFYLPLNLSEHAVITKAIFSDDIDNPYKLSDKPISEANVDIIIQNAKDDDDCGYMFSHNKCDVVSPEVLKALETYTWEDDILYKGQSWTILGE